MKLLNILQLFLGLTAITMLGVALSKPANAGSFTKTESSNLVINGDFSAGNIGFITDYNYTPGNIEAPGLVYSVGTNPRNHHQGFVSFSDRTTGDGLMMIVNGAPRSQGGGPLIWSQKIDVTPNTNYDLSAWVASAFKDFPAQLQFAIDSEEIGSILNVSATHQGLWENLMTSWNSGAKESITLSIINHNSVWFGNDFALDDISMITVEPSPKAVPEPSSILGLFALSGLGVRSLLKRKPQ